MDIKGISGIGGGKTLVSVKDSRSQNNQSFFSLDDIKELAGYNLTFTADSVTKIDNQSVVLIGTNSQYPDFENITLENGCFFNETALFGADQVVVVDEKLAWDIFKRLDVTGDTLELFAKKFKIVGVVSRDTSLSGLLSDSGTPHAYIPASTLCYLDKSARITTLQIENQGTSLSGENRMKAVNVLRKLGKTQEDDYYITDLNLENVLIAQKPRIIIFLAGIAIIVALLKESIRRAKAVWVFIRNRCESDYWQDVLKNNGRMLLQKLAILLLLLLSIVLFWETVGFDIYIPPEYLPKQLIDFAFYFDLFKKEIGEGILHRGYLAPLLEVRLNSVIMLSNCLFYVGLLLGLPMVLISLHLTKLNGSIPKMLITLCLTFIAAMALATITILLSGLPLNVNGGDLAVVFSFIYIYSIKLFYERKGKVSSDEKSVFHYDVDVDGI